MRHRIEFVLVFTLISSLYISASGADESISTPEAPSFFSKLVGAVKKGVTEGVDNGVQLTGSVKVLGYTMMYSKLKRSDQPAYCLENADSGKLITVAPVFGTPYGRSDGTTGFTVMAQQVDKYHDKVEVNLTGVLPGLTCADLIAQQKLNSYNASGPGGNGKVTRAGELQFSDCYGRFLEPAEKIQLSKTSREADGHKLCFNKHTERPESILNLTTGHLEDLPKGFTSATGMRTDGSAALPSNVQAGWDKVDRIQREGIAKIEADNAARDSINAEKSVMRKAAFEKCRPLISRDNSNMEAFKTCYKNATK